MGVSESDCVDEFRDFDGRLSDAKLAAPASAMPRAKKPVQDMSIQVEAFMGYGGCFLFTYLFVEITFRFCRSNTSKR